MHLRIHARRSPPRRPAWTLGIWSLFWGCIVSSVWSSSNVASSSSSSSPGSHSQHEHHFHGSKHHSVPISIYRSPVSLRGGHGGSLCSLSFTGALLILNPVVFQVGSRVGTAGKFNLKWWEGFNVHKGGNLSLFLTGKCCLLSATHFPIKGSPPLATPIHGTANTLSTLCHLVSPTPLVAGNSVRQVPVMLHIEKSFIHLAFTLPFSGLVWGIVG